MSSKNVRQVTDITANGDDICSIRGATHVTIRSMTKKKNAAAVNAAAVTLGALGGRARGRKLSKKELSEQGRKAVLARWAKSGRGEAKSAQ
jgi:hypothetical protein